MLKIKDDINLKELEKFGFMIEGAFLHKYGLDYDYEYFIDKSDRKIVIQCDEDTEIKLDDTLYDLIQAGLVEKVGG